MVDLVVGSRFARIPRPDEDGTPLETAPWTDAFRRKFEDDAHAWPYLFYQEGEQAVPQWRMPANLEGLDGVVLCNFLFFDLDGVEHDEALQSLSALPEGHYLRQAAVIYFTKAGLRIVYRLEQPVMPEEYGPIVRGMAVDLWTETGLRVDPTTDQWHRCFRLPYVVRADGKADGPTWEQPYFREPFLVEDVSLRPDDLPQRKERLPWAQTARTARVDETKPDLDDDLPETRKRLYRAALRNSRFKDYIFEPIVELQQGRRDTTLLAMSGDVVAKCYTAVPEAGPGEIFLLLLPAVRDLPRDGEEWHEKLWRLVSHAWGSEARKETDRKEKQAKEQSARDIVVEKMLAYLPPDEVPNDPVDRIDYARRHYCLQTGASVFVVRRDGTYGNSALKPSQLPAHFNDGLQFLVEGGFRTQQGAPLGGQDILNAYSVNVDSVEYVAGREQTTRLTRTGDRHTLQVTPFCLRQDLLQAAEFDADIDGWLNAFPKPTLLKRWLAASLAVHLGGVAALYLHGPARVGKSMLAQGIAECFQAPVVPGAQAFAEFNGSLMESPVVMVDEGLPTRITGMDVADLFRSLITGGPVSVMRKRQDALTSKIPYRVIFAANSFDMVKQLIGRRTMSAQDRDAFRERILVIDTGVDPASYLDSRGAMEFTKHHAKGSWLGGDCRLARHLIRLYQMHFEETSFERSGRLLVEGEQHPAFTLSFDLGGAGRDVVDELVESITKVTSGKGVQLGLAVSLLIESGCVWVARRPYVKLMCMTHSHRDSSAYSIALDRFLLPQVRTNPMTLATEHALDLRKLIYCAQQEGLSTAALQPFAMRASGVM